MDDKEYNDSVGSGEYDDLGGDELPEFEENTDDSEFGDDADKKKKRNIIIVAVIVIVAIIAGVLFWIFSGDDEAEPEDDTTISVPEESREQEPEVDSSEGEDTSGDDENVPSEEPSPTSSESTAEPENDLPYDPNTPPEPRAQSEPTTVVETGVNEDHAQAHGMPFDPESGLPAEISHMIVQDMFSIVIKPENSFEDNFNEKMEGRITSTMEATGFKPWWPADGPEHNEAYRAMMNSYATTQIMSFPELISEERIDNDIILFHYRVPQKTYSQAGYVNVADFEVQVEMMAMEDGRWLMNDYYFPDGRVPSMH